MKALRCLIVDDEPLAIDVIVNYLHRLEIGDIEKCASGIEAYRLLQQQTFDLLFLDIEMPGLTGFDLLKTLPHRPLVIITTAYREHAVEGFDWDVLDYLVKPVPFPRFLQAIDKAVRAIQPSDTPPENDTLLLRSDRQWVRVAIDEILYLESLKDYVRVVTARETYIIHQPLTDITTKLPPDKFARVHRSYTIAFNKIARIKDHIAYIGEKRIPISRAHRAQVYKRYAR
jgi:two-component system, LytTR family, response regulator